MLCRADPIFADEIDFSRYDDETVYVYKLLPDGMEEVRRRRVAVAVALRCVVLHGHSFVDFASDSIPTKLGDKYGS